MTTVSWAATLPRHLTPWVLLAQWHLHTTRSFFLRSRWASTLPHAHTLLVSAYNSSHPSVCMYIHSRHLHTKQASFLKFRWVGRCLVASACNLVIFPGIQVNMHVHPWHGHTALPTFPRLRWACTYTPSICIQQSHPPEVYVGMHIHFWGSAPEA